MTEGEILIPEMDDIPERYRFRVDGPTLDIDFRESLAPTSDWTEGRQSGYVHAEEEEPYELVLPTDESGEFGYEGAFRRVESADGWVTYRGEFPRLDTEDQEAGRRQLMAFCGTLELAFDRLSHYQSVEDGGPEPHRLFLMLRYTRRGVNNRPMMDVRVTPELARWVKAAEQRDHESEIAAVIDAMRVPLARTMRGYAKGKETGMYETRAEFREDGLVYMQTPGQATALTPENLRSGQDGYEMMPSNCDSISQQMAFVFGLAKLEETSRRPSA